MGAFERETYKRLKMKILFVNNSKGRGGGEEFLRDLLPGLIASGATVGLICRPNTPLVEMFSESKIAVRTVDRSGLNALLSVVRIARIIRRDDYTVISVQRGHDVLQSWAAALVSFRNPALIYTVQVPEFLKSRFLLQRMDTVTTISRYIAEQLRRFAPAISQRLAIFYYGIDVNKFSQIHITRGWLRDRFNLKRNTKIIATVGDLWKNQIEFLDSLAIIRRTLPDTIFALVGEKSDSKEVAMFKRKADELGVTDAILWVGRLSKDDMMQFYADVDVAVSTHRNEGFGIWVLEALAMGTPVVSVNAGGIRDSLEDCPAGILVDGGPTEMSETILRILTDDSLRESMADAGPRWVAERFKRERMIDDYYHFFKRIEKK